MAETRARASGILTLVLAVLGGMLVGRAQTPASPQESARDRAAAPASSTAAAVPAPGALADADIERFLKNGKVIKSKGTKKGITDSVQATIEFEGMRHDAHIQTVDEYKREFRSAMGVELDFRDSWTFNIAAYKLDRMIGLNMVPVSVPGHFRSSRAAVTWWIDDVMMDEGDRLKKKIEPPDMQRFRREQAMMRLFDELIANSDRNMGNILYTSDWRLWLIDHTRAFRKNTALKHPGYITRCERPIFEKLKSLDRDTLKRELGEHLDDGHIKSLLARRDAIVAKIESLGPTAIYDR